MTYPSWWEYQAGPLSIEEYREPGAFLRTLNEMGREGWEFAGTVTLDIDDGGGAREHVVFKRRVDS